MLTMHIGSYQRRTAASFRCSAPEFTNISDRSRPRERIRRIVSSLHPSISSIIYLFLNIEHILVMEATDSTRRMVKKPSKSRSGLPHLNS